MVSKFKGVGKSFLLLFIMFGAGRQVPGAKPQCEALGKHGAAVLVCAFGTNLRPRNLPPPQNFPFQAKTKPTGKSDRL